MNRFVKPELLDALPPADPRAVRSRKDLVRLNTWMGNCRIMAQALQATCNGYGDRRLAELGAGDGRFLLGVAQRLPAGWRGTNALLLDRLQVTPPAIRRDFQTLGWHAEILEAEALDWLAQPALEVFDAMLANLFLHHFREAQLAALLRVAAKQTWLFIAVEPRRSGRSLLSSRLLWFIRCNHVTRHDAPVSVRAGFAGRELSRLWPAGPDWTLQERPAGRFSHLFIAQLRR